MAIRNIYNFLTLLIVISIAISTGVCSSLGHNLVQDDAVKLEILEQSNSVYVHSANVYEKNNTLAVYGSIRRTPGSHGRIRCHVDISVMDSDGKLITEKTVLPLPRQAHSNVRTSWFSAYLDIVPPPGSVIQVVAHKGIHR